MGNSMKKYTVNVKYKNGRTTYSICDENGWEKNFYNFPNDGKRQEVEVPAAFEGTLWQCRQYVIEKSPDIIGEGKKFKVNTLTLDTAFMDQDWPESYLSYNCPVITVPRYFCSRLKWRIVNYELTPEFAKINGIWYEVHSVNHGRVGEHREPTNYPNTRINKVLTSKQLSCYFPIEYNIVEE